MLIQCRTTLQFRFKITEFLQARDIHTFDEIKHDFFYLQETVKLSATEISGNLFHHNFLIIL